MRLKFGEFIFDSDTRELLRDHKAVTLSPKAFQLLEILIHARPKALSKAELHDHLWPKIRHALDDDPQRSRFVRTVHRFGYAFHGEPVAAPLDTGRTVCRLAWKGGSATLREGEHIIGRDADAAIMLDSPSVSRRHARVRVVDGQATFEDLGSKNGSHVAGQPIHGPVALRDGDAITVGIVKLTFRMIRPALPTASVR